MKSQTAPAIFKNKFCKPIHKYPTNFSTFTYSIPLFKLSKSKQRISTRGPTLWKNIPRNYEKMQKSVNVFENSKTKKLLELESEVTHFKVKLFKMLKHD